MSSPFGPDDLDLLVDEALIETDADRAFEPQPGCCDDCDEEVAFAALTAQFHTEEVQR